MKTHRNARTTWHSRLLMVRRVQEEGWSVTAVARSAGVSRTTVYRWLDRYAREGEAGLWDRSSAPHRVWNRTPPLVEAAIESLRWSKLTAKAIAARLQMALSTVGEVLRRLGLSSWRALEPREPVVRYERPVAGDLLHIDIKRLGAFHAPGRRVGGRRSRGAGFECLHVCVDDHSRVAFAQIEPNERQETCVGFLRRAVSWYELHGVRVREVMTDNGSGYVSHLWAAACAELGLRHIRIRPYRPQTNGKAERLIQTLMREWAYARVYESSGARSRALGPWLERYNHQRPHRSLGNKPPASRLPRQV